MRNVVVFAISHKDKVLVSKNVEEESEPLSNIWLLPGGGIEDEETPEEAVVREMREEVGLEVSAVSSLCVYDYPEVGIHVNWMIGKSESCDVTIGDELADAKFIPANEVFEYCNSKAKKHWPKELLLHLDNLSKGF